jgi:hypothetical protein
MKKVYPIILVSFLGSLVFLLYVPRACFGVHDIYPFYSEQLRTPLFTGFLTLGAFLLSLQTFILIRLREFIDLQRPFCADNCLLSIFNRPHKKRVGRGGRIGFGFYSGGCRTVRLVADKRES